VSTNKRVIFMTDADEVRWGLARRFEFIEWRIYWTGRVNRKDIEDRFGVSSPQASVDLRSYEENAPGNIFYDSTKKTFVASDEFVPRFLTVSADQYLLQLNAIQNGAVQPNDTWFSSLPPAAVMQTVIRSVDPLTLREILRAIEKRYEIDVTYQSLTKTRQRTIAPHSIAFDGHRWHTRAWCTKHAEFRDFVLTRILSIGESRPSDANPSDDMEWNTLVELNITAHPGLAEEQKRAIEHDFGIKDGSLKIKTRLALAFYFIKRLNLDIDDKTISPARKQIFLTNLPQIEEANRLAIEETRVRVASRKAQEGKG
jgi:hypothetical protein